MNTSYITIAFWLGVIVGGWAIVKINNWIDKAVKDAFGEL